MGFQGQPQLQGKMEASLGNLRLSLQKPKREDCRDELVVKKTRVQFPAFTLSSLHPSMSPVEEPMPYSRFQGMDVRHTCGTFMQATTCTHIIKSFFIWKWEGDIRLEGLTLSKEFFLICLVRNVKKEMGRANQKPLVENVCFTGLKGTLYHKARGPGPALA